MLHQSVTSNVDYTNKILEKLQSAKFNKGNKELINSFENEYFEELSKLNSLTLITTARFQDGAIAIVVLVSDWENAPILENRLQEEFSKEFPGRTAPKGAGFWADHHVSVIRDIYKPLYNEEEYQDNLLVGSRIGEGGMTCGVISQDAKIRPMMLQCGHGYKQVGTCKKSSSLSKF